MAETLAPYLQYAPRLITSALSLGVNLGAYLLRLLPGFKNTTSLATPAARTDPIHKCRFRLDNASSDTFTLPDGRQLGYAQYGSLTGKAVFYLHGLPGSRMEGTYFHELGLELGARIVATDRPGIGWSSPHPDRTLLDFPKDLERLAKHLELGEYAVVGVSGGGPYALACAASLPRDRLKCVSIVCGLGQPDVGMRGANWIHWIGFTFGWRYSPRVFLRWFLQSDPTGRVDLTDEQRLELMLQPSRLKALTHEKDLAIMKDEDILRVMLRSTRESFAHGYDAVCQDGKLICMDFGFRIKDIRSDLPIQLWYGKDDTFVPLNHGEQIAARLGGRAHFRVLDETHASIFFNNRKEILRDMLRTMQ